MNALHLPLKMLKMNWCSVRTEHQNGEERISHHICFLCTCRGSDGLAHQADAGAVASQHGDVVVLPARQVEEVAVGVVAVALGVVAEASPGVHRVRRGAARRVPSDHGDFRLAVDSCGEVSGNAGRWRRGKHRWRTF